jgi:hypothetical protein
MEHPIAPVPPHPPDEIPQTQPIITKIRKYYPTPEIHVDTTYIPTDDEPLLHSLPTLRKTINIQVQRFKSDNIQGDTGANCSATNNKNLLWNFKTLPKPIPIVTYQGTDNPTTDNFEATGTGIIKMIIDDTIMEWLALYTPNSTGTIISPDRYMMDNGQVEEFIQSGKRNGQGYIRFTNKEQKTVAKVKMKRRKDGLWYTDTPVLMPPPTPTSPDLVHPTSTPLNRISKATTAAINPAQDDNNTDKALPSSVRTTTWTSTASQALKHLEVWHQRMGHPSPRTLQRTAKVTNGIPQLPGNNSHFHCPFCDVSKLQKSSGNPTSTRDAFLPGTAFHMDLGFIRGPKTITDSKGTTKTTKTTTAQLSHDGYSAYLIIIDAATRYVFCFPLKTRSPPIALIDRFLSQNGRAHTSRITTMPNGLLHKSNSFSAVCTKYGYSKNAHKIIDGPYEELLSMGLERPRYYIRTDNGNELAGSQAFRETANNHDFLVETTAPDSSSENGLSERPHRTLKEKVRCLLYTAGLGVEFWSDALLHAVWLYNRTYHTSIDKTPFEAWTGRQPCLDRLLTFGAKITARKAKTRTTTLDPNSFSGIFLGYRATMDHIIYWDDKAQCRRTAKHLTSDELQYGDPPNLRSPAAKHLIEVVTGTPHAERRTDTLLDTIPEICQALPPSSDNLDNLPQRILMDNPLPHSAAAAKAKFERPHTDELHRQLQQLDITLNIFEPAVSEHISILGSHPTAGLIVEPHPEYSDTTIFKRFEPGTPAHRTIKRWKSRIAGSIIRLIDDEDVYCPADIVRIMSDKRRQRKQFVTIQFAQPTWSATSSEGVPTLQFDQLNVIAHHMHAIKTGENLWTDPLTWPPIDDDALTLAIRKGLALPKITRRRAKTMKEWPDFLKSEWSQLNKYHKQGMFGTPCPRPPKGSKSVVLPWVWTYLFKIDPITLEDNAKSRGTCNGGSRHGKVVTLAETYAACVEQPIHRLAWAITAGINYISIGCDVSNAFAEAPPPSIPFFMEVDAQFLDWWVNCLGNKPIPIGWVIPILRNLQGHPEAPRLWHKHINNILVNELGFDHTTHEPCLYFKHHPEHGLILLLRQVDDFMISAKTREIAEEVRSQIQSKMTNELNDLGIIKRFNGMDVLQTRQYVKISCQTYIDKIISHHDWANERHSNKPIPMRNDSSYLAELELSVGPDDPKAQRELEEQMGFNYRQVIGEAIFAMTLCRLDIAPAIIKLSQYSSNPAKCHYQAAKALMVYLHATRNDGIYYWRPAPNLSLPDIPPPTTISTAQQLAGYPDHHNATNLKGASDSTWATDRQHRRSTGGIVFFYAGGAIYYRSRIHPTVAQSSTEAELAFMTDAGKAALYLRSILEELHLEQLMPTPIDVDNRGARQLTNAQQPTRRTRHIDMRDFCILQWTEEEQILYSDIPSAYNVSDSLSKPTGRIKFYEQMDILMGRRQPAYASTLLTQRKHKPEEDPDIDLDNPASPCNTDHPDPTPQLISGSTCSLSKLSIYPVDISDLDCLYDLDHCPFSTLQVWGGDRDD